MKSEDRLLEDVLKTENYCTFQNLLADVMVLEVRRRKAAAIGRRWLALAACLAAGIALFLGTRLPASSERSESPVEMVRSVPLAPGDAVRTLQDLVLVSSAGGVEVVQSTRQTFEPITDEQLLGLFRNQPVALVRAESGEKQLILPNAELSIGVP